MEEELARLREEKLQAHDEIKRLTGLIEDLRRQLQQALDGNEELLQLLKDLQSKLDVLIVQTKKTKNRKYGKTTEKHNPRPAPAASVNQSAANNANQSPPSQKAKLTGIKHIVENAKNVPHEPIPHRVKAEELICPECNIDTVHVDSLLTQQLEMVSVSLKILDHLQETRACPSCRKYIVTAEKPCAPIPGSYAGPRLLAEIIVSKLDDGLPNTRQEKIFARHNITIPRSTQSDWMQTTADTLSLLHDLQRRKLLESSIIMTDDSFIKIQD
jgi:transposase